MFKNLVNRVNGFPKSFSSTAIKEPRLDKLYKEVKLEIRSHESAVIESYIKFAEHAAKNLDIKFNGVTLMDDGKRYVVERQTCLRSAFVHKKHREQYEARTYIKFVNLANLTESTADTYLEYVERNLPEGCSMIVHKYEIRPMFVHLKPPVNSKKLENK